MPAWRTGYYRILNLANGVQEFSAQTDDGEPLQWHKVDKSTWRIQIRRQQKATRLSLITKSTLTYWVVARAILMTRMRI